MSTQTQTRIPAGTHRVDPVHSSIGFAVVHSGVSSFRSGFSDYEATLTGGESPSLQGSVDLTSVEVGDENLKGHLLSPEFFDAEAHPRLRFTSTSVELGEGGTATVRGELEMAGKTREVEAEGRFGQIGAYIDGNPRVGLSLNTSVDRRDFGIDWNADLPGGEQALDYRVDITVELEFAPDGE